MQSFQDLKVWQKMHQLTLEIYNVTKSFPSDEKFGIVPQLRRSSASVATNIVEGFNRASKRDQVHFFNIAVGSLEETKYHLILSRDLNYLSSESFQALMSQAEEVGRMLCGFRRSVVRNSSKPILASLLLFYLFLNSYSLLLNAVFFLTPVQGAF